MFEKLLYGVTLFFNRQKNPIKLIFSLDTLDVIYFARILSAAEHVYTYGIVYVYAIRTVFTNCISSNI